MPVFHHQRHQQIPQSMTNAMCLASGVIALLMTWLVWALPPCWSQALDVDPSVTNPPSSPALPQALPAVSKPTQQPFRLRAVESYTLPPEMYGQWTVIATLMKSNMPQPINPRIYDVWQLNQAGDKVALSNPNTGAFASITVDQVEGNTATFHHKVVIKPGRQYLIERPTVTVNGNRMVGTTTHSYVLTDRNGQVKGVYTALFRIDAQKLAESRVAFGSMANPDLSIEDIQTETRSTSPETVDSALFSH